MVVRPSTTLSETRNPVIVGLFGVLLARLHFLVAGGVLIDSSSVPDRSGGQPKNVAHPTRLRGI